MLRIPPFLSRQHDADFNFITSILSSSIDVPDISNINFCYNQLYNGYDPIHIVIIYLSMTFLATLLIVITIPYIGWVTSFKVSYKYIMHHIMVRYSNNSS